MYEKKEVVSAMEDERIVALYWDRDEVAIEESDRKYGRYLAKIAHNVLGDLEDSRESVNDTYYAAWNSIPPHRPGVLSTYLGKLTRRIAIDMLRRRTREKRGGTEYTLSLNELEGTLSAGNTTEEIMDEKLLGEAISAFLRTLSPEARNTFIGRYYFMDPLAEVARYCGMSESRAKSMLHRTRGKLKEYLLKEGFAV